MSIKKYNFRFLDWQVYKDSKKLHKFVINIAKNLPVSYRSSLGDQILRSSLSVALNIAEGSGKQSSADIKRYIQIASGSLTETIANADIMHDNQLISESELNEILQITESIARQLGGIRKSLI